MTKERDVLVESFRMQIRTFKTLGLTRADALAAIEEVYGVRRVNGFEVVEGWTMPEPPIERAAPCVQFHGGDGLSLFWWHSAWGDYPCGGVAFHKGRELGISTTIDDDPLVDPDTGFNYKACEEAYRQLGFKV